MGLSHAPDYICSEHFSDRALERFGVDSDRLDKWVARQIGSLTLYSTETTSSPDVKKYVSDDGIIFVCDTVNRTFVTCYEANDMLAEGQKITIHEYNVELFSKELTKLAHKYRLKDSQEMLLSTKEHLEAFYQLAHTLMVGRLTEKNYQLLSQLIDEYHAVKAAMKVIEQKRGDFKC
ncbi:hypothetical protein [Streptococcus sp. sy018]|uniref:hypothetical protein n=1 Tax=Streptococcus sp. sy018 TaxID=2600147 RepID=UPI0011B5EA61|nr:hypothetical protein [Streptococcus sp. sy018]TWS95359.1 hypothetical protein FRX52_00735 [Streptococcus sp. sy018]